MFVLNKVLLKVTFGLLLMLKVYLFYVLYILVFYLKCHIYQNCSCYLIYSILLICLHQLPPQIYKNDLLVFSSIVQTYRYWSDQVCLTGHCQYEQNIH